MRFGAAAAVATLCLPLVVVAAGNHEVAVRRNTREDAVTILLAVRMLNATEDDVKQCGKELANAREILGAARSKVDAKAKEVFQSEARMSKLKDHDVKLEKRVDAWVHKLEAHENQIKQLELLVNNFQGKVERDEVRIRSARERVMDRVKVIKEKEVEHKAGIEATRVTQQAFDRLKNWPNVDRYRLHEEEQKLREELESHAAQEEDIQGRVVDVNKQLEEIEEQIASWEQNKQIVAGIVTYLEWSEKSLEDGQGVFKNEEEELANLDDLVEQRRDDYERSKKELVSSREEYGKAIKGVISSQEKQITTLHQHHDWDNDRLNEKHDKDLKKQADASEKLLKKVEAAHEDHVDELKDRLDVTVGNLRGVMQNKEKSLTGHAEKALQNQAKANQKMEEASEKHVGAMKEWHKAEMEGMKERNKGLFDRLKEGQKQHKEAMRANSNHIDQMRSTNRETIDAMHKSHGKQTESSQEMQDKQQDAMRDAHEQQLDALRDQHEKQLEVMHDHHLSVSDDTKKAHEDRIRDMKISSKDNLRRLEEAIAVREDAIAARDLEIRELIRLQNDALEEHHAEQEYSALESDKDVLALRHQLETQMSDREVHLTDLMDQQALEIAERDNQIEAMEKMALQYQALAKSRDDGVEKMAQALQSHKDDVHDEIKDHWGYNKASDAHSDTVDVLKDALSKGQESMASMKGAFAEARGKMCNCAKGQQAMGGSIEQLAASVDAIKGQMDSLQQGLHGTVQEVHGSVGELHRDLYDKVGGLKGDITQAVSDMKDLHVGAHNDILDVKGSVQGVSQDINAAVTKLKGSMDETANKLDDSVDESKRSMSKSLRNSMDDMEDHVTDSVAAGTGEIAGQVKGKLKDVAGDLSDQVEDVVEAQGDNVHKDLKKTLQKVNANTKKQVSKAQGDMQDHVKKHVGAVEDGMSDNLEDHHAAIGGDQQEDMRNLHKDVKKDIGNLRKQLDGRFGKIDDHVGDVHGKVAGVGDQVTGVDEKVVGVGEAVEGVNAAVGQVQGDVGSLQGSQEETQESVDNLHGRYVAQVTADRVREVNEASRWPYGYGRQPYGQAMAQGQGQQVYSAGHAFPPQAPYYAPVSDAQRFQASLDYLGKSLNSNSDYTNPNVYNGRDYGKPAAVTQGTIPSQSADFGDALGKISDVAAGRMALRAKAVGAQSDAATNDVKDAGKPKRDLWAKPSNRGIVAARPPAGYQKKAQNLVKKINSALK